MIEFLDITGVVGYRLEGKISTEEMTSVLDLFREIIARGEKINLYQEVTSIGGVEFEAMGEKLKFFLDVGLSNFGRIAVVADKKWIPRLVDLEGRLFRNIEMRGFSMEEKDAAIAFLKEA
ncbi:MAG: STAS/SEC14 domain-containing protein [Desulfobacterales bacterium]|nr:STAS/SEC14 domain-containing protein [Desulfobacterales bacterium]